ncbi:MAG: hypothetical protein JHD02_09810 [Thermoleophilaceae bacterium]|nr:hypothetical protein [Thermoleophilaceae bacterium]
MTETDLSGPHTETEARESNAKLKKLLLWSPAVYGPFVALILWLADVPYWAAFAVAFVAFEFASYPFISRALDRNMERQIAEIRERERQTRYPDVGI